MEKPDWPANFPDLSPVENQISGSLAVIMDENTYSDPEPNTMHSLRGAFPKHGQISP